jgi:hypothetical protein
MKGNSMKIQRIEDNPAALERFTRLASAGNFRDATQIVLLDFTIDEATVRALAASLKQEQLATEVELFAQGYEPQIQRRILLRQVKRPAHVSTHARASYHLRHYDMLEEFARALQALATFNVHATREDISPELAAWAESREHEPGIGERISTHFDLGPKKAKAA